MVILEVLSLLMRHCLRPMQYMKRTSRMRLPILHLAPYEWNDAETFQSRSLVHSGAPRSSVVNYRVTHGQGRVRSAQHYNVFMFGVFGFFFGFVKKYPTMDRHHPSTNERFYI